MVGVSYDDKVLNGNELSFRFNTTLRTILKQFNHKVYKNNIWVVHYFVTRAMSHAGSIQGVQVLPQPATTVVA